MFKLWLVIMPTVGYDVYCQKCLIRFAMSHNLLFNNNNRCLFLLWFNPVWLSVRALNVNGIRLFSAMLGDDESGQAPGCMCVAGVLMCPCWGCGCVAEEDSEEDNESEYAGRPPIATPPDTPPTHQPRHTSGTHPPASTDTWCTPFWCLTWCYVWELHSP